jgi:hypothetical protein
MKIYKSIIATILFIIFIEIIGIWTIIFEVIDKPELIADYYIFVNGLIEILIVALFLYKLGGYSGIFPQKASYTFYIWAFVIGVLFIFIQTPLNLGNYSVAIAVSAISISFS